MPSICIQIYVLGLLVLMGSRAEEVSVEGSISNNSTSTPTDTPSTASLSPSTASLTSSTANLTPSTANLSPSTASLTPSTASLTPSTASLTPSTANLTPSTAHLSPSTAHLSPSTASLTPSTANQTAQTTSSGLTALSQSQGRETTATTETTTSLPATRGSDIAGYVILFLILLAVVCLVVILYILRKKSRRYSFDLQYPGYDHDTPLTCMEQPGTFEPNNDQEIWESEREGGDEDPHAMSPVANGSAMGAGETGSTGENEGEKQAHGDSDGDSFNNFCASDVTPPIKRVGFSLDLDLSDKVLLGSSPDL
ncbi:cell wall integrity and stress response component 1 [Oncorhynchus mykiss]|uniref:cell wall integrity and stress response component 1 n=1 Tax=Oncorhynchus mykiss TaxID=8022 RepID=UPI001877741C|nr:cell wall integrity and stress response component 1 [Oncorhynchus mykiss]